MLKRDQAVFSFVDVQGNLAQAMFERDQLFRNIELLLRGFRMLQLPILWTEQLPEKLGPTTKQFLKLLNDHMPVTKSTFSCWGERMYQFSLGQIKRRQVVLAGIEAHICICQTALDLLEADYEVYVVSDAVSSRRAESKETALQRMSHAGVIPVTTEMVLMELLRDAHDPLFRDFLQLIK